MVLHFCDKQMNTFTIHHLSDVHFGSSHYKPSVHGGPFPQVLGRNGDLYVNYLSNLTAQSVPDLVIVSGDLTTIASEEEMDTASDFLHKILRVLKTRHGNTIAAEVPRLLIVPGNHDLDWLKDSSADRHKRYARLSDGIYTAGYAVSSIYQNVTHAPWIDFGNDANLFICLLNSTYYGGSKDPALSKIYEQIRAAANQLFVDADALAAFRRELQKDPGYVLEADIKALSEAVAAIPAGRTKLAVVHHNPNHVPSDDIDAFDTIVNAGRLKAALLQAGFDLVLHGHRHVFHCSVESHPSSTFSQHKCFFLGADSLGCKEHAPFLEVKLTVGESLNGTTIHDPSFSVREFEFNVSGGYSSALRFTTQFSRQRQFDISDASIQVTPGMDPELKQRARGLVSVLLPKLQAMQSALMDWKDDSDWIRLFHIQLHHYQQIFATDIYERANVGNPSFHRYLREQYIERLKRLRASSDKILRFSPDVFKAVTRTQWQPNPLFWPDYQLQKAGKGDPPALEVVRIIIVDPDSVDELELRNLDFDHSMFAIPLFVIDRRDIPNDLVIDFALGMNSAGSPIKACAYDPSAGLVVEQKLLRAYELFDIFEKLLAHKSLRTVDRLLGAQPMIQDPATSTLVALNYAKYRKPSPLLIRILENHFLDRYQAALDLCCGTGNYTIPFVGRFKKLTGLDVSPEMLANARERSNNIEWIESDAKETPFPNEHFDAAWMISALHYFGGEQQKLLFAEVYRILRSGGIFIADTEFSDQHPSLWLVEYFPSLRERYKGRLFSQAEYRAWLEAAGFQVEFQTHDYYPEQEDAFLRIGQHMPRLYLNEQIQAAIPAFQSMNPLEKRSGLLRLKEEITNGEIPHVIAKYKAKATVPGDIGVIVARRT